MKTPYHIHKNGEWHSQSLWEFINSHISFSSEKILDVGAGNGEFWYDANTNRENSSIIGTDIQLNKKSIKMETGDHFVTADSHYLPFSSSSFTMTTSFFSIHQMQKPIVVLDEIIRVTKSNGLIVFLIPSNSNMNELFNLPSRLFSTVHEPHFRTFDAASFVKVCNKKLNIYKDIQFRGLFRFGERAELVEYAMRYSSFCKRPPIEKRKLVNYLMDEFPFETWLTKAARMLVYRNY